MNSIWISSPFYQSFDFFYLSLLTIPKSSTVTKNIFHHTIFTLIDCKSQYLFCPAFILFPTFYCMLVSKLKKKKKTSIIFEKTSLFEFLPFSTGPLNLPTFYVHIFSNELSITFSMVVSVLRSQLHCSYREKNSKRFARSSRYDRTYSLCDSFFK